MGEITGFNRMEAQKLRSTIQQTASSVGEEIATEITNGIIKPMADAWYAENAVTFFENFKASVNEQAKLIRESFDKFRQNLENITNSWAETTGAESVSMAEITAPEKIEIDISSILPKNSNGDRYLDDSMVEVVITSGIPSTEEAIKSQLASLSKELNTETAFLGHGQDVALKDCFAEVVDSVHTMFETLLTGEDSLKTALDNYRSSYIEAAENIARNFTSGINS